MKASSLLKGASIVLFAAALLNGCSKAGFQFAPPAGSVPMEMPSRQLGAHPPPCTPTLWASSFHYNAVYGYTAPNSPPCVSLHGMYAGLHFHGPYSIAIGSNPNYLYVADLYNNRIVVFDYSGNYVKWLNTKLGNTSYEPWGVCVSSQGTLGVGNIQEGTAQGNAEFFPPTAASGSLPTGDANGQFQRQTRCAFDSAGNFFISDGTSNGTATIDYLASSYVGLPGQTLVDSGLGTGVWVSMYSRIDDTEGQTLSVATSTNFSTMQNVYTWTVSGPSTGPLAFTPYTCSPYVFHHYHSAPISVDQVAPSAGGASGILYFAEPGGSQGQGGRILQGPANGGHITIYKPLRGAVGVATNPSGQY